MKKRTLIAIVLIAIICIGFLFSENLILQDYGTDLNADTTTDCFTHCRTHKYKKGNEFIKPYPEENEREIHPRDMYVTSWHPNEYSQLITSGYKFQCSNSFGGAKQCGPLCDCHDQVANLYGPFNIVTTLETFDGDTVTLIDTHEDYWNTEYITVLDFLPSSYYIGSSYKGYKLNDDYFKVRPNMCGILDNTYCNSCEGDGSGPLMYKEWYQTSSWNTVTTPSVSFELKGPIVGKITTNYLLWCAEAEARNNILCDCHRWHISENLIAQDEAYLGSGVGGITITSTNAMSDQGTEITDETDVEYTKYVYEEGGTVEMEIDTGFSGGSEGQWQLTIYNSIGEAKKSYDIPDDRNNYPISYTVPDGAFIPNDENDNEWSVVLKNTLFNQAETQLFVIDDFDKVPGKTNVYTDKNRYMQFEKVDITLEAYQNSQTQLEIDHFKIWGKYDSWDSNNYALTETDVDAVSVLGQPGLFRATLTNQLQLEEGNKYVYIHAYAIDTESRAGPEGEAIIFSEQEVGNYEVTVNVQDQSNNPITKALVKFYEDGSEIRSVYSDHYGTAEIYVPYGHYDVRVTKKGYNTYKKDNLEVKYDGLELNVTLQGGSEAGYISIIISALIIMIGAILSFTIPQLKPLPIRIAVISICVGTAILIYLVMEGII